MRAELIPSRPRAGAGAPFEVDQRRRTGLPLVIGLAGLLLLGLWIPAGLHHAIMGSIGSIS
jgi:hypothetical protein